MLRRLIVFILTAAILAALSAPIARAGSNELRGRVIILDAGHGASTTNTFAGYDEQVTMLKLALMIKPLLESRGATVHLTREDYETVLLSVRAAMVNILALEAVRDAGYRRYAVSGHMSLDLAEINRLLGVMQSIIDDPEENARKYMNAPFSPRRRIHPDLARIFELQDDPEVGNRFLFISLHSNATPLPIDTTRSGAYVFHICTSHRNTAKYYGGYSYIEKSRRFGDILLDRMDPVGLRRRGVEAGNFFVIREHNVPGVLVENGFHTNAGDRANLSDDAFLERLAHAYLAAVKAYFNGSPLPAGHPALMLLDVRYGAWHLAAIKHMREWED